MNDTTPAQRLRQARLSRGWERASGFARSINVGVSTYSNHENGIRDLKPKLALKYSAALGIDLRWLLTGVGEMSSDVRNTSEGVQLVPVISLVQAGNLNSADPLNFETDDYIPAVHPSKTLVGLEIKGDSMNLEAPEGSVAIVDYSQTAVQDGQLVIAKINDEVTFKMYRDQDGPLRLEPRSTAQHKTLFPDEDLEILGRVVGVYRKT